MAFPLFVLAMGIVAALGNTVANIVIATAVINLPFYALALRAMGRAFTLKTFLAVSLLSLYAALLPRLQSVELAGEPQLTRSTFVSGLKPLPIRYELH